MELVICSDLRKVHPVVIMITSLLPTDFILSEEKYSDFNRAFNEVANNYRFYSDAITIKKRNWLKSNPEITDGDGR